jgi:hypothetical protein
MTDTQERFLRAILTRVPLDSVVELHLFPAIRRGTLETGVAVIATVLPTPLSVMAEFVEAAADDTDALPDENATAEPSDSPYADDDDAANDANQNDDSRLSVVAEYAPEEGDDAAGTVAAVPTAFARLRILTASYRHTIKGIERGKWIVDVQEEADAPQDAVEAVLRGVRHRSTEPADPELIAHDALSALLAQGAVAPAA